MLSLTFLPIMASTYGAKGMGELVFNGASAAYVDAVERALNTRFTSIPIPPEAIEEAMKHVH